MGRKLDALLGRSLKTSKFKALAKLAISRTAILKNQRQVRCSHARSDVIELLNLGHQERALLRVEHVIKDQNMLDVFAMIDSYCNLLIERVALLQKNKECPDELKEGISSLIFATSRCGEFPELQKIRQILTSRFGKDFVDCAIELRNNCGVNPKMIQKLSTRQPSLEIRLKMLKEIASEIGVTLHLEEDAQVIVEEQQEPNKSRNLDGPPLRGNGHESAAEEIILDETFSESMKGRKKYYSNAAAAAQDAFESAAYAAAAARAAVELSRSESRDNDPDDHSGSTHRQGTISNSDGSMTPKVRSDGYATSEEIKRSNNRFDFDKNHHIDNFSFKEMDENNHIINLKEFEDGKNKDVIERALSTSSSDSGDDILREWKLPSNLVYELLSDDVIYDKYENKGSNKKGNMQSEPCLVHDQIPIYQAI